MTASAPPDIRETLERIERENLAPAATLSAGAVRQRPEPESAVRTAFQRDRDRIIHTKSFRRLMHKTQVFIAPLGDHYRTRLTHTLEVTQIARTIGRALRLNEDLIEAIGLGHDLGHTPFGHMGETALAEMLPGFRHNEQSLRIVDRLEKDGQGLNLTHPVRDGILRHSKPKDEISGSVTGAPMTREAEVVKIADGVAYINHDLEDALRAGMIAESGVPPLVMRVLGQTHAARIDTLVRDIISRSSVDPPPGSIAMSDEILAAANALRRFLFERVYTPLNEQEDAKRAHHVVQALFAHYVEHPGELPPECNPIGRDPAESIERATADYVASMTDRFAVDLFQRLFVPRNWSV